MDIERVKMDLEYLAETAGRLSQELGREGRVLTQEEKGIVRMSRMVHLKAVLNEAAMFYWMENKADFIMCMKNAMDEFQD